MIVLMKGMLCQRLGEEVRVQITLIDIKKFYTH